MEQCCAVCNKAMGMIVMEGVVLCERCNKTFGKYFKKVASYANDADLEGVLTVRDQLENAINENRVS